MCRAEKSFGFPVILSAAQDLIFGRTAPSA
jgi:hypothetical protein